MANSISILYSDFLIFSYFTSYAKTMLDTYFYKTVAEETVCSYSLEPLCYNGTELDVPKITVLSSIRLVFR
jgi:hypothetical protein